MPPSTMATEAADTALRDQVRVLTDRSEITTLIDRYVILLDTQDENGFDDTWPRRLFTEDVHVTFPVGEHRGLDGLAEFHYRAKQKFDRTHHIASNYLIDLDGDRADVRFQMIAIHVHPGDGPLFEVGGHYEGEAVRTDEGWRIRRWGYHVAWSTGPRPE
ncbi:nuclear transport factor 2 family protein [Streptomyces macrosporus]|uniref:SnoaL-like domain-containing protein n=1 Tax=Streptomyces macrosporus TaxID=44032 RepID=A0ABP5WHF7_9ACTN